MPQTATTVKILKNAKAEEIESLKPLVGMFLADRFFMVNYIFHIVLFHLS